VCTVTCYVPGRDIAGARTFSPKLTPCHGVRSLFGHPRSISSPIVQIHLVVWKEEAAELWVKRCTVKINPTYVWAGISSMLRANGEVHLPHTAFSWKRCGSIAEALRARRGRIAEAVQLVRVPRQTALTPGQGYSKSARQLWCCTTYVSGNGLVASEVGQCDMQSPFVEDRSALAAVHGGS